MTTKAHATRNNLTGHGVSEGIYFGRGRTPEQYGTPVTITRHGFNGIVVTTSDGTVIDDFGGTGKFWLAPLELTAEQVAADDAAAAAAAEREATARATARAARLAELADQPAPEMATWVYDSETGVKVGYLDTVAGVVPLPTAEVEPAAAAPAPVVIVPCGGKKAPGTLPAGEKYIGSYHLMTRKAAAAIAERTGARVLILSARYGLLELADLVDDYDLTMSAPGAVPVGRIAEQAAALGITDALVTVVAGKAYADRVTAVWPHAVRVLDGTNGMPHQMQRMAQVVRGEWTSAPASAAAAAPALFGAELVAPPAVTVAQAGDLVRGDVLEPGTFGETHADPVLVIGSAGPVDQPGGRRRVALIVQPSTFAGRSRHLVVWADRSVDVTGAERTPDGREWVLPPAEEAEILDGPGELTWPRLITGDRLQAGDVVAPGGFGPWNKTDTITVTSGPRYLDTVAGARRFDVAYRVDLPAGPGPEVHGAARNDQYVPVLERRPAIEAVMVAPARGSAAAGPLVATVLEDNPGETTVHVAYAISGTRAWVARARVLGPAPAAIEATPSGGTALEESACRALPSVSAPYVVGMTDTATAAQAAVITYYATGVKPANLPAGRGFTAAETVCFTRGWIVDTETFPYSAPTTAGRAAAGLAPVEPAPVAAARLARPHYSEPDFTTKRTAYVAAAMLDAIGDAIANPEARFPADVDPDVLGSLEDAGMAFAGRPTNRGLAHHTAQRGTPGSAAAPAPAPLPVAPAGGSQLATVEAMPAQQLALLGEPLELQPAPARDLVASSPCGAGALRSRTARPDLHTDTLPLTGGAALVDPVNLHDHDFAFWNTSAGKDSMALGVALVELARAQGYPLERIVAVHCDLGRVEWAGTAELAAEHAAALGVRFYRVAKDVDLLEQVSQRHRNLLAKAAELRAQAETLSAAGAPGSDVEALTAAADKKAGTPAWPSSAARWCTSDQKTTQVEKLMTALAKIWREAGNTDRPIRILNTLGIRAAESPARALKTPLGRDSASNGRRDVTRWLPIFGWSDDQVWATIRRSGLRVHGAYQLGMSRLSCGLCVLSSRADLVTAARANPQLVEAYAAVEDEVGTTFQHRTSIREIGDQAAELGPLELPEPAALDQVDQVEPAGDIEAPALTTDTAAAAAPALEVSPAGDVDQAAPAGPRAPAAAATATADTAPARAPPRALPPAPNRPPPRARTPP